MKERKGNEKKEQVDTGRRLSVEDFQNPMFDRQEIRVRTIRPRNFHLEDTIRNLREERGEDDPFLEEEARDMLEAEDYPEIQSYRVIEGATYTDGFILIGFTYDLRDSSIRIVNTDNEVLFKGFIYTPEEYEKSLKKADQKQRRLDDKKFKS